MLQGMRAKSLDRFKQQQDMDRKLGILADTSRGEKKVMQGYFEVKHHQQMEEKRLKKDTERGMNLYVNSAAKYRDGALTLSKKGIQEIEGKFDPSKKPKVHKKTYDEI